MATHLGVAIIYTIPSMLFCLLGSLISTVYGEWISPPSTLPSAASDKYVVTGSYNGTIFLLGGDSYPRQTTEYQINTDTFTTTQTLPTDLKGYAQCWTQLKETMYMVEPSGSTLSTFNMITKQYTPEWLHLDSDVGVNGEGCLAVANHHLFITGGWPNGVSFATLQVLDLTALEWIKNTPPMQQDRCSHTCVAHYNYLWVFGGWGTSTGAIDINERINITSITSNQWAFIDPLSTKVYGLRATAWQQSIFVTGGFTGSGANIVLDKVHVADAITGKVVVSPDRLVYGIAFHGTVIVQNVIYLLGGGKNTWMYYQLTEPTSNPTTTDPTTANPTTPAPTSPDPTTADPTTANPTTTDPTTADPTTANPTTTDPTTADP
eukprot:628713_1